VRNVCEERGLSRTQRAQITLGTGMGMYVMRMQRILLNNLFVMPGAFNCTPQKLRWTESLV